MDQERRDDGGVSMMKAAVGLTLAVASTIEEMGPLGAPEGPIYMALMQKGHSLEVYEAVMRVLVRSRLIRRSGNVAYWIGPSSSKKAGLN